MQEVPWWRWRGDPLVHEDGRALLKFSVVQGYKYQYVSLQVYKFENGHLDNLNLRSERGLVKTRDSTRGIRMVKSTSILAYLASNAVMPN